MDTDFHPDFFVCHLCGGFFEFGLDAAVERQHKFHGGMYSFWVDVDCAERSLCTHSSSGIHGEVFDGEDEEFLPELWPDTLLTATEPFQLGQCSLCRAPMRWSSERQRWEDLTRTDDVKTLLDALRSLSDHLKSESEDRPDTLEERAEHFPIAEAMQQGQFEAMLPANGES